MIIALGHRKHVGKDTVGSIIMQQYSQFRRVSIASRLKTGCAKMFNIEEWMFNDEIVKDQPVREGFYTPRQILQQSADNLRGVFGADVFIQSLDIDYLLERFEGIVITDLRYLNEVAYLRRRYPTLVKCVRIDRSNTLGGELGIAEDKHESEKSLESYTEWDYVLENNGSEEELELKTRVMMVKLFGMKLNNKQEHD